MANSGEKRILLVVGTRPEAIKMAPLFLAAERFPGLKVDLCTTGQHREMLDQVLSHFGLKASFALDLMREAQGLSYLTGAVLENVEKVIVSTKPDWVVVQGDTTTTFASSLAAFYQKRKVAHVEAGLRTGNIYSPWPEEVNRKLTTQLTTLHFPPTSRARANLLGEGVPAEKIEVTGNTVIDALLWTSAKFANDSAAFSKAIAAKFPFLDSSKRMVLVTGHRRENFGEGLERVFSAIEVLARRNDIQVVFPVHLNPMVQKPAAAILSGRNNVFLISPQPYAEFVWLMMRCHFIITDSGGVQEEAPSLQKPVLVTRDTTERPEAVDAGTVELVGTDAERLAERASALLDDAAHYEARRLALNPYGDGKAADRILSRLLNFGAP